MSVRFKEQRLRERLSNLPRLAAVAFAAACAARLENTARNVAIDEALKDLLSRTMDAIGVHLETGLPFDTLAAEEELLTAMPDEDANPDLPSAVAEDAAAAEVYTLRVTRDGEPQNSIWAARRAYETADREVVGTLNVGAVGQSEEKYVLQHPVVQTELQRQLRDLEAVSLAGGEAPAELIAIVSRARSENILKLG
jgi:hypothetical protein